MSSGSFVCLWPRERIMDPERCLVRFEADGIVWVLVSRHHDTLMRDALSFLGDREPFQVSTYFVKRKTHSCEALRGP